MLRPKIGLDWDDVTAPFNSIAIAMANEKYHIDPPLRLEEIDTWENRGRTGIIREFYEDEELYARQQVPEKNKKAVYRLMEIADVYFITAVAPAFMGIRAKQILTAFPEFPPENIILGNAKNLVQFDIILDDAIHNVLETPATYPVLMRKPWNWKMTGLLSVNQMSEFVSLVRQIIHASQTRTATEQKMAFHSIVRNVLGAEDEHTDDVLLDLQQNLSDMIDEYAETHDDDEDVFLLDKEVVTKLLADSDISEEKAAKIEKSVDEAFGEKPPAAENVIDSKALVQNELRVEKMALEDQVGTLTVQLNEKDEALAERTSQLIEKQEEIDNYIAETKTYDVVLRVKPEKASQIKSQVINGQKCLVIPMGEDEHATINGVNTTV